MSAAADGAADGTAEAAADPSGPWDPGLQPERTALAWQRTGLSVAVAALVGFRDAVATGSVLAVVLSSAALAAGVYVLRAARTELDDRVEALRAGLPLPAPVATRAAAFAVLALAATVLAIVLD
ncbi:DUF202 domain-containing protein [Aquipuribacter sp. MA13-6]|uniref:DUF202 domain-containing protein n=1 Tax=unclassified Aquipuribacter TaxID=2635084 RepID=UPI003EE9FA6A